MSSLCVIYAQRVTEIYIVDIVRHGSMKTQCFIGDWNYECVYYKVVDNVYIIISNQFKEY